MRVNQVIAVVLLSVQVVSCTSWKPERLSPSDGLDSHMNIKIVLEDDTHVTLSDATIREDSVVGRSWESRAGRRVARRRAFARSAVVSMIAGYARLRVTLLDGSRVEMRNVVADAQVIRGQAHMYEWTRGYYTVDRLIPRDSIASMASRRGSPEKTAGLTILGGLAAVAAGALFLLLLGISRRQ